MRVIRNEKPTASMGGAYISLERSKLMYVEASNGNYDSFNFNGSKYVVPTGKVLRVHAYKICAGSASSALATLGSSTALVTNSTIPAGWAAKSLKTARTAATEGVVAEGHIYATFAAGVYPGIIAAGACSGWFLCEEVAA